MNPYISAYNDSQLGPDWEVWLFLAQTIERQMTQATGKIWQRHPVWFLTGNPVVGTTSLGEEFD